MRALSSILVVKYHIHVTHINIQTEEDFIALQDSSFASFQIVFLPSADRLSSSKQLLARQPEICTFKDRTFVVKIYILKTQNLDINTIICQDKKGYVKAQSRQAFQEKYLKQM